MRYLRIAPTLLLTLSAGCQPSPPPAAPSKPELAAITSPSPTPVAKGLPTLTPIQGTGALAPSTASSYSFVVFGDNQGSAKSAAIVETLFQEVRKRKPALAFCLGDIVRGKDPQDPGKYIAQKYDEFKGMAQKAGVPVFNAPGNHEMDDANDIPSDRMHQLYVDNIAPLFGAFDYGNARFIGLNTEDVPPQGTPPPPDGIEFSYLSDAQLQALDADLAASTGKTHVFLFMHYPLKPKRPQDALAPESAKKLNAVLSKYKNISYVLASHEHLFYNPQDPTNVKTIAPYKAGSPTRYLVSGGAGADMYVTPESGGFHHYLVFNVAGDTVTAEIVPVE